MPAPFASRPAPKLVFGPGSLRELPACVREIGGRAVFLVSDTGLAQAGHIDAARGLLEAAGIPVTPYDHAHANPTEADAAACAEFARGQAFDCIVALGGGSSIDTAKAANFLLTNGGRMRDYHGYGKAAQPLLPSIAIPTTAGTGSECQSYGLVSRDDTHEKMACGDPKARPQVAILDPDLTATLPRSVGVQTGLDALAHALEAAVCTKRNAVSALYAEGAFREIAAAIGAVVAGRASADDRGRMLLGAALGGLAIENSMLGAAHATANPLTARYDVVHGYAVALMLPHVLRFNAAVPEAAALYARFSALLAEFGVSRAPLADWVDELVAAAQIPRVAVPASAWATLAEDAARQWTGNFNPRPLQPADSVALYRHVFGHDAAR